jgi:hypothetical protein
MYVPWSFRRMNKGCLEAECDGMMDVKSTCHFLNNTLSDLGQWTVRRCLLFARNDNEALLTVAITN